MFHPQQTRSNNYIFIRLGSLSEKSLREKNVPVQLFQQFNNYFCKDSRRSYPLKKLHQLWKSVLFTLKQMSQVQRLSKGSYCTIIEDLASNGEYIKEELLSTIWAL